MPTVYIYRYNSNSYYLIVNTKQYKFNWDINLKHRNTYALFCMTIDMYKNERRGPYIECFNIKIGIYIRIGYRYLKL